MIQLGKRPMLSRNQTNQRSQFMSLTPAALDKIDINADDMLTLMRMDVTNEVTHMSFYLMNAATVRGLHRVHIRPLLEAEAKSEMEHVRAFTDKLVALGTVGNPKWTGHFPAIPEAFGTYSCAKEIINEAIRLEAEVVINYKLRIEQAAHLGETTGNPFYTSLSLFYEEQLEHSHSDLDNLRQIAAGF